MVARPRRVIWHPVGVRGCLPACSRGRGDPGLGSATPMASDGLSRHGIARPHLHIASTARPRSSTISRRLRTPRASQISAQGRASDPGFRSGDDADPNGVPHAPRHAPVPAVIPCTVAGAGTRSCAAALDASAWWHVRGASSGTPLGCGVVCRPVPGVAATPGWDLRRHLASDDRHITASHVPISTSRPPRDHGRQQFPAVFGRHGRPRSQPRVAQRPWVSVRRRCGPQRGPTRTTTRPCAGGDPMNGDGAGTRSCGSRPGRVGMVARPRRVIWHPVGVRGCLPACSRGRGDPGLGSATPMASDGCTHAKFTSSHSSMGCAGTVGARHRVLHVESFDDDRIAEHDVDASQVPRGIPAREPGFTSNPMHIAHQW